MLSKANFISTWNALGHISTATWVLSLIGATVTGLAAWLRALDPVQIWVCALGAAAFTLVLLYYGSRTPRRTAVVVGAVILLGGAASFFLRPPLPRLAAFDLTPVTDYDGVRTVVLTGFNLHIKDSKGEGLIVESVALRALVDDTEALKIKEQARLSIDPNAHMNISLIRNAGPVAVPYSATRLKVTYEVRYDSLINTGPRRTVREVAYQLVWASKDGPMRLSAESTRTLLEE